MDNNKPKISVLLVEPHKYPKVLEIDNTLEAMQELVGGHIEEYMPFEDDVAIVCNEEGKINGDVLNRAIYSEPEIQEMTYKDLVSLFRENEKNGGKPLTGYIVFTKDSFADSYTEAERTYAVSSRNKAYMPNMGGYSIFGNSLDGGDKNVRLEQYRTIIFDTIAEHHEYEILSVFKTVVYTPECFKYYQFTGARTQTEFNSYIQKCKELSLYDTGVSAKFGDKFITLSTL